MADKTVNNETKETFEELPIINNGSVNELRIACDECLSKFLTEKLGYEEDHQHSNTKLLCGYIACAFAAMSVFVSYKLDFQESKLLVAVCVIGYFIFSSSMSLYTWKVQQNEIFEGQHRESKLRLKVSVVTKPYSPTYQMSMKLIVPKTGKSVEQQVNQSFTAWFDKEGHFAEDLFKHDVELLLSQCEGKLQD
ncbi:hypothetical protein K7432_009226 [Basidiobolus ranarum]|uniref:Signal peptidase complex subunit 2 n=1 Tax=Basidiobolus ranarum TaxID=34480 RepID=A0ABR2WQL2_9FUNG